MPGDRAVIKYEKCNPGSCGGGICVAAQACDYKVLKQLDPNEMPMMDYLLCLGCGDCMRACPMGAITITRI
jgi:translation initiation factor RLI1